MRKDEHLMIGLIFDVDGVVGDTESINARASVQAFKELYGAVVREEDFLPFIGMGDERYMEGVAEKYGVAIDVPAAAMRRQENVLAILAKEGLAPYAGVLALMRVAHASRHMRLAIATSGAREKALAILAAAGVDLAWFDAIVTGSEVHQKKPDPALYHTAIRRLGLAPTQCVVIEDAPAGVQAAHAAGAKVVAVTNSVSGDRLAAADKVVASLVEVTPESLATLANG